MNDLIKKHTTLACGVDADKLEADMLDQPQVECGLTHFFGPGVCVREVTIPAGTWMIGREHRYEHVGALLRGRLLFVSGDGFEVMESPTMLLCKPGRKMAYAIEESVFQNIFATNETDIEKIEDHFTKKSERFVAFQEEQKQKFLEENEVK